MIEDVLNRLRRFDRRKLKEVLIHYEDIFGKAPVSNLLSIKSREEVPEEFLHNLKALIDMFQAGKVRPCEKCPTCREIMRVEGKRISVPHGVASSKPAVGRYSEALDAQIELAKFWLNSQTARNYFEDQEKKWDEKLPFRITTGALLNALAYGETFYWSEPICQLIMGASRSLPQSWILSEEVLDTLCGFAWLGSPCEVPPSERPVRAIAWIPMVADGQKVRVLLPPYVHRPKLNDPEWHQLSVVFFSRTTLAEFPYLPTQWFWPFGSNIGQLVDEMRNKEANLAKASLFATMLAFLQQRILIPQKLLADRMARHRFERAKQKPPSDEIKVITLRRVERRTGEGEHRDVEWACRWIVSGHWRNQWYPSRKHYRPKWIAPYLKGPEDKPLRNPGRLFAVVR